MANLTQTVDPKHTQNMANLIQTVESTLQVRMANLTQTVDFTGTHGKLNTKSRPYRYAWLILHTISNQHKES